MRGGGVDLGLTGRPALAFLASERASYVTGAMLSVDGGLLHGLF